MGAVNDPAKKQKNCDATDDSCVEVNDAVISYNSAPCMTWIYTDHQNKSDIVCVAVPVISGSQDINFGFSIDGMNLIISYTWPAPMYSPALMFSKKPNMSLTHPKIQAFASRVVECEFSEVSRPKGNMVVPLPIKVQREVGTWTKEGFKLDDCNIILLEFKAYQKKLIIEDADTSINFV